LHFKNIFVPDSPFGNLPLLRSSLLQLLSDAQSMRPEIKYAQMASWLNALPVFLKLFPKSWAESSDPGLPGGHLGWWGQFMDRHGRLNHKYAEFFKNTGEFPFMHTHCTAPVKEMIHHLQKDKKGIESSLNSMENNSLILSAKN